MALRQGHMLRRAARVSEPDYASRRLMDDNVSSIYEEVGGSRKLDEITRSLYDRVLQDARLIRFFDGADMTVQRRKMRSFLSTVTGGPQERSRIELRAGHSRAVERGLTHEHFDAFVGHFCEALEDCGVQAGFIEDLLYRVEQMRSDVLGL